MTLSYSSETYTSGPLSTTTEYKLSDGSRWVRIVEEYIAPDMKARRRTRVLRSDFPGDNEHRDTLTNLQGAIANANVVMYVEPSTAPVKLDTAAVTGSIEEPAGAPVAYRIEPGYEEEALPLTTRQVAVLAAVHDELGLDAPLDVLPPVERNEVVIASHGTASRFLIEVDAAGYVDRAAVRYEVAGFTGWADLPNTTATDTPDFRLRIESIAAAARRTVPAELNH
jgi:hypothetical protein